jgi:large subunit ribosomal protein L4
MSKVSVVDIKGAAVGEVDVPDALLVRGKGDQAVHDAVVAYQAGLRAGTASTLGKGAVAGSNRKPWRQKGTGRARAGYRQSPVWRGGGVAHGPHPRDFSQRLPRKVAALAFRRVFSDKVVEGEVRVVEALTLPEAKTRHVAALLKALGLAKGALIVTETSDRGLIRAARNIPNVEVASASDVCTYQILRYPVLVTTRAALVALQARVAGRGGRAA